MSGTPIVKMEGQLPGTGWTQLGTISVDEPPASIQNYASGRREIYLFGWYNGERGIWRSKAGADASNAAVRSVLSRELEHLSSLDEPLEMLVQSQPTGPVLKVRFSATTAPAWGRETAAGHG